MIRLYLITFLLPIYLLGQTGQIRGIITDATSGEPLPGVNIVISDTQNGTASDESGYYQLSSLEYGTYRLEFTYIGYAPVIKTDIVIRDSNPIIINIALMPQTIEGDSIVVTAGYFPELDLSTIGNISLNREEIRRFPGGFEDVVRTVATLPGVSINNSGGRNDLLVRGGGPSENLYLVEGFTIPNINHFSSQGLGGGALSYLNLDFVENVNFSAGSFGANYGQKLSSVLDISLRDGRTDRLGGKLLISATQFGLDLEGPYANKKGNYIFSARKSYLDLIFKAAGLPFVPIYSDLNFVTSYKPDNRQKFTFLGLAAIDNIDRDVSTPENRVINSGIMENTQRLYNVGFRYDRLNAGSKLSFWFNSNLSQYRFSQADTLLIPYFKSRSDETEWNIRLEYLKKIRGKFSVRGGYAAGYKVLNSSTFFADTIYDRNGTKTTASSLGLPQTLNYDLTGVSHALYLLASGVMIRKLFYEAGIRLERFPLVRKNAYISPRINLRYKFNSRFSLKTGVGKYVQPPAFVWLLNRNNRHLEVLQNNMILAGGDLLLSRALKFSFEGYFKKYSNIPTGNIPGVTDYLIVTNTGSSFGGRDDDFQSFGFYDLVSEARGQAYGVEINVQKKYSAIPIYGQISLSYGKSEYTAGNGKTYPGPYDQRWILNIFGGYKPSNLLEFSGKFRFFTGIPYTPVYVPDKNPIHSGKVQNLPDEFLSARLKNAYHLDLRVDRFFYFRSWTLITFLDIQNITNYKIPVRPTYNFWDKEIITSNSIAILPSIGISAKF